MADYEVMCVNRIETMPGHDHVVRVGATDGSNLDHFDVTVVRDRMARGDTFYTISLDTGARAEVEAWDCCQLPTIRSSADATSDSNLDSLINCPA